jgi:hypothetical protein
MSDTPPPAADSDEAAGGSPKQSYHPPQLRGLGTLAELTGTGGAIGPNYDGGTFPNAYAS